MNIKDLAVRFDTGKGTLSVEIDMCVGGVTIRFKEFEGSVKGRYWNQPVTEKLLTDDVQLRQCLKSCWIDASPQNMEQVRNVVSLVTYCQKIYQMSGI